MTGNGSEAMFSHSVLLVEGEGDRLFFETLRRRMAAADSTGHADRIHVIAAGGKTQFSPWISLFKSYLLSNERPIKHLVVPDADAGTEVLRAFNDADQSVPQVIRDQVGAINQLRNEDSYQKLRKAVSECNALCRKEGARFRFLNPELEDAMLLNASSDLIETLCGKFDCSAEDNQSMIEWLSNSDASGRKAPWKRRFIGQQINRQDISDNVKLILQDWLGGTMKDPDAAELVDQAW